MNCENSINSLAYSNPTKATSTESSIFNENSLNYSNHRRSNISSNRSSDERYQSQIKKTKKKQISLIEEEGNPKSNKQNFPQSAPLAQKKKRGLIHYKNPSQNGVKLVTNLDSIQSIKKKSNLNIKQNDKESKKSQSIGRNSFQSQSSFSSFRSNSSQNRNQGFVNRNGIKNNSLERDQSKSMKNLKGNIQKNFGSAFSSIKTNGKSGSSQINPAEKKYQEDKKRYELLLKLVRVKNQEFCKKCKTKPTDWKKIQKAQAKQKVQDKICLCNEGLRLQQNMQKAISDIESEQSSILTEYNNVSEEMKARFKFFEETVAPYEEKMQQDLSLRDQLTIKTINQQNQLEYQKQINSNIQEDNSSLSLQTLLLMEQITALKAKKQSLLEDQTQIDLENKQLKENADLKQQHINILQKHYDEQASRSLWLKKEINLKKKGIFNINIISEQVANSQMEINNNKQRQDLQQQSEQNPNNQIQMISEKQHDTLFNQEINIHYSCQIKYLISNDFELLRSIADFEYFTPNQIYGFFYSDNSYTIQISLLLKFMTFFSSSKVKSSHLIIYNNDGISNYSISNLETSFENIISSIQSTFQDDSLLSPAASNLGFTLHLEILNQQYYLGKQFNVLIAGINQSTASQNTMNQLNSLFFNKKMPQIDYSPKDHSILLGTIQQTNTQNQLKDLIEKIQKQKPLDLNQLNTKQQQNNNKENQMVNEPTINESNKGGIQLSFQQQQQNQQIKAIKKVKYNEIQPMISKNVKNININQGTPKGQRKKDGINQTSNNRFGTLNTTGGRSQSENRSGKKGKDKKLEENLNKIADCSINKEERIENIQLVNYINEFFRKTNRLYSIHFDLNYNFQTKTLQKEMK